MTLEYRLKAIIKRISNIDTCSQRFYAEVGYRIKWKATDSDLIEWNKYKLNPKAFQPENMPKLAFPNANVPQVKLKEGRSLFCMLKREKDGELMNHYEFTLCAQFIEQFELINFPFDCQDLPIIMKLENKSGTEKNVFTPDTTVDTFVTTNLSNSVFTEWDIHPTMAEFGQTEIDASTKNKQYALFILRVKASRKYQYYLQKIVGVTMLLSGATLTTYSVAHEDKQDRLSLDFTLILTIVAFQLVINNSLPILPFLTIIDWFMLGSVLFIFIITVQQAVTPIGAYDFERIFIIFVATIWIIFHVSFFLYFPTIIKKERKKLTMNTQELKAFDCDNRELIYKLPPKSKQIKKILKGEWVTIKSKENESRPSIYNKNLKQNKKSIKKQDKKLKKSDKKENKKMQNIEGKPDIYRIDGPGIVIET